MQSECEKVIPSGEWVTITYGRLQGYSGFVLKFDLIDERYKVMVTTDPQGKVVRGKVWVESDDLTLLDIPKDEDYVLSLIDLALDTGDKEWFMELTSIK